MSKIAGNDSSPVYTSVYNIANGTTGAILAVENSNDSGIGARVWITRAWMEFTAAAAAACTLDVGVGDSASDIADTRSDDIFDGINAETGTLTLNVAIDSVALDIAGATASSVPVAWELDDFLLVQAKTGNATGLVGKLYVQYTYA